MFPLLYLSPNDYRFTKWRRYSLDFADMFARADSYLSSGLNLIADYPLSTSYKRKSSLVARKKFKRLRYCSDNLNFKLGFDNLLRLNHANFCRDRMCLLCNWRRRLKYSFNLYTTISSLHNDYNIIFATFTAPNVHIKDLRLSIQKLHKAFNYLLGYGSSLPTDLRKGGLIGSSDYCLGSFRTIECTRRITSFIGSNKDYDGNYYCKDKSIPPYGFDYHPHLHAILLVDKNASFIPHNDFNTNNKYNWVSLWTKALIRAGYPCNLDILQQGYNKNDSSFSAGCRVSLVNKNSDTEAQIKKSIYETSKYGFDITKFKSNYYIERYDKHIQVGHLVEFANQIHNQNFLVTNGILRGCVINNNHENLVSVNTSSNEITGKNINFTWDNNTGYYLLSSKDDYNKPLSFATTNHEGINPFEFV